MNATKPYEFIGFGPMDATKPYEFIGFEAMDTTKCQQGPLGLVRILARPLAARPLLPPPPSHPTGDGEEDGQSGGVWPRHDLLTWTQNRKLKYMFGVRPTRQPCIKNLGDIHGPKEGRYLIMRKPTGRYLALFSGAGVPFVLNKEPHCSSRVSFIACKLLPSRSLSSAA